MEGNMELTTNTQTISGRISEKKNLGDCHDFYIQSDTLLLADVFEKLCSKCIEIDKLDSVYFLSTPGKE